MRQAIFYIIMLIASTLCGDVWDDCQAAISGKDLPAFKLALATAEEEDPGALLSGLRGAWLLSYAISETRIEVDVEPFVAYLITLGVLVQPEHVHSALFVGREALYRRLLLFFPDTDLVVDGLSLVIVAILANNLTVARELLDAGQMPAETYGGLPLLAGLIRAGISAEMLGFLIDAGIDIEAMDNDGNTPLAHAVLIGRADVARLLVERGANLDIEVERESTEDAILLVILVVQKKMYDLARAMLAVRATFFEACLKHQRLILMFLIRTDKWDVLKFLNELGLDLNFDLGEGHTLFSYALELGRGSVASLLLLAGALPRGRFRHEGRLASPLLLSVIGNHEELFRVLIRPADAVPATNINQLDSLHRSPLWWAASLGREAMALSLIRHGADIEAVDSFDNDVRYAAAANGHVRIVRIIDDQRIRNVQAVVTPSGAEGRPVETVLRGARSRLVMSSAAIPGSLL